MAAVTPEVGGGVVVRVDGTRYSVTAEVLEILDDVGMLLVKANGNEAWIPLAEVRRVLPPSEFVLDQAVNQEG